MKIITTGKINVISVYCAWILLLALGVYFAFGLATGSAKESVLIQLFCWFCGAAAVHFIFAFFVRCPHCNKCLTIQTFTSAHPASTMNWASVVTKWFTGSVVCIHCGKRVDTKNL